MNPPALPTPESDASTVERMNVLKAELQHITEQAAEVELECEEHRVVLETLQKMPHNRKCFQQMNSILLELTVGQAIPVLEERSKQVSRPQKHQAGYIPFSLLDSRHI